LHNNKILFEQVVMQISKDLGISTAIIEKDYYVTLFLKELVSVFPDIVFKGGTSLSKCYGIIDRFSEDIDLTIKGEEKNISDRIKKQLKRDIISVIEKLHFELTNPDDIRSRRKYNKYIIDYNSSEKESYLKKMLIVETVFFQKAFPTERRQIKSIIYNYLIQTNKNDIITQYSLEPFEINVQSAERTMVDKIYALADYYMSDRITEHSRHLYDIYKLSTIIPIDEKLKNLVNLVKEERKFDSYNISAQNNVDIKRILQEIIDKNIYKKDYNTITKSLLFEKVSYETVIKSLQDILSKGLFDS